MTTQTTSFKTLKLSILLLLLVLTGTLLAGCGSSTKLADCFDEDTVKEQALADITLAESNDFAGWQARFSEATRDAVTEDAYTSYMEIVAEKGAFTEYGKSAIIGQEQDGKNYAVAVIVVKHENGDIQYTIGYDEDMHLIQFTI